MKPKKFITKTQAAVLLENSLSAITQKLKLGQLGKTYTCETGRCILLDYDSVWHHKVERAKRKGEAVKSLKAKLKNIPTRS